MALTSGAKLGPYAVLYEMTTGTRPFEGKSQISVASAILEKDPEPLSSLQPVTPSALEHVVSTCLAKNPDDRFQTAHAGTPIALFQSNPREMIATSEQFSYDVSDDGQRFLINTQMKQTETMPMSVVLNWGAKLNK